MKIFHDISSFGMLHPKNLFDVVTSLEAVGINI